MASETGKCPTCSASLPLDSKECPECGETVTGEVKVLEEDKKALEKLIKQHEEHEDEA